MFHVIILKDGKNNINFLAITRGKCTTVKYNSKKPYNEISNNNNHLSPTHLSQQLL